MKLFLIFKKLLFFISLLLDTPVRNENDKINIKIADFGLARTNDTDLMTGVLGTFVISYSIYMFKLIIFLKNFDSI